jgi:tetratricopeptide (TPR) repeat protein
MLRYLLVINNLSAKNFHKASEYAQLTLKSLDSAKQPDAKTRTEMQQVRLGCYQVIANDLIEKGQCADAIPAFKKAMEIERSGGYYYDIGLCFDKQKQIDEAMLYYATTELMGGQYAPKAKARLEMLYKALHNDTLVGIDKVYKHAKEQMEN